jgi:DNA-binding transcriptional LysR family regulator
MLNPLWLKTFTAAAAAPSFTEAARRLGLTQPTVSEHIRQLEQSVNRRLFLRDTHSLVLTSDGRSLLVHAEIILDAHERAERLFDAPRLRGRVRLGTSDDLAMGPLPDVLAAFRLAHPEVELDLTIGVTSELYKLLDDNGLDVMIGKRRRGDRRGQTLHKEALLWRAKEGLRFAPDEPLPLILLREPSVTRTLTLDALARVGRSTSYAGCQAAARAGLGITVQPSHLSTAGLAAPGGAIQLPALPQVEFIVISAPSPNKPTRALTEILMRSTLT